ncbi:MAG: peptidoglycan-binding domain-containing protein [Alphaproteobacteria bacterium]
MPTQFLQGAVGCASFNAKHDVALLQAAFKSIKNPVENLNDRTWWPHAINGMKDLRIEQAIKAFQAAHGLSVSGCVRPGDNTERKIQELLPRERKHMRCFANTTDVYCFNPQGHLQTGSLEALKSDPDLPPQLATAVHKWLKDYGTGTGKHVLLQRQTIRQNSVDFALNFSGVTLLDVNGHPIRGRTTAPAEIAALNSAKRIQFAKGAGANAVMRNQSAVVEIVFDTAAELRAEIDGIFHSPSFRHMTAVVGGFSKALEADLYTGVKQDVAALQKEIEGPHGSKLSPALKKLNAYGKAVGKAAANELDHFADQIARELKSAYGGLGGLVREIAGGEESVGSRKSVDVSQQQSALADAIAKAATRVGLDEKKVALFLDKFGRRFFLFSLAISIYKIFAAEDKVRALQGEAVNIIVDAAITGAVAVTVAVFTGPAILAIVLGVIIAFVASDEIDAAKREILDSARSIPLGPIFVYARD